jgi:tRNA-modifying protein YgfZ
VEYLQNTSHFLWQPSAWLRVTGEDVLIFLQGQHTNNLNNLIVGGAAYGLWLNQKGKVIADSFIIRMGEYEFLVGSYLSEASVIRERLEAYIIADDVTIADETADWGGMTFFTDATAEEMKILVPGGVIFRGRRGAVAHWEWVAPIAERETAVEKFSTTSTLTFTEMERRRIVANIPAIPQDIGVGELPNEGGLDLDAVSYTKGCYLGQEVMARLKAMGQVRRRLVRVEGAIMAPSVPATLFVGDRKVGELRSAVASDSGFVGLALVTLMHVPLDKKIALSVGGAATIDLLLPT